MSGFLVPFGPPRAADSWRAVTECEAELRRQAEVALEREGRAVSRMVDVIPSPRANYMALALLMATCFAGGICIGLSLAGR